MNNQHLEGETLGSQQAADLSTLFDIGGIFGGVLAGLLSDLTGMSAFTCSGYFILTIPAVIYCQHHHIFIHLIMIFFLIFSCSFTENSDL